MAESALLLPPEAPHLAPAEQPGAAGRYFGDEQPGRRIEIPPYDLETATALRTQLGLGPVLAQILVRRGLGDPQDALEFLSAAEAHPPGTCAGMEEAVTVIQRHVRSGGRIVVHGDYDVDGVCATAVMIRALRALGADPSWYIPSRTEDGYGLSAATVERLAARGTDLLITVDCAITAIQEVALAARHGIEVVLTDHHAPPADGCLPAATIVHPGLGGYPCPDLCGTGVAHKLVEALGASTAEEDLDLVALATVADLVPLRGENRRLVRQGLHALANTGKEGLRALLRVARCDPSAIDAAALGFRLAPRINASGRLRRADAALELLLTADPTRAQEIAAELDALNAERRAAQQRIAWEAEQQVASLGSRPAYVLASADWHPGVIGIVASRIAERHHRPAVLVAVEEGGLGQGSGRSIPGFDLLRALQDVAPHLLRYGGHRAAAGLTMDAEQLPAMREAFERHAEGVLSDDLLLPRERVDAVVCASWLGLDLVDELAALEPCGLGNPAPRLLVPGARVSDVATMGEGRHARFSVISGGARARAVSFGCDGRVAGVDGAAVDATFRLERNVWNGSQEARLILSHAQPCRRGEVEVVGEPEDYLLAVREELERGLSEAGGEHGGLSAEAGRIVLDRRGENPVAVLADACAAGTTLAVCSDVPRRLTGLRERAGGFSLISHPALVRRPLLLAEFPQLVVLDPPSDPQQAAVIAGGDGGFTHLAWGEPELRFARQMHRLELCLRDPLVALYRSLRGHRSVGGQELEEVLRGGSRPGRSPRLAARLLRVLDELRLVRLDAGGPSVEILDGARTELERSPSYRAYARMYEDGVRFLSDVNPPESA